MLLSSLKPLSGTPNELSRLQTTADVGKLEQALHQLYPKSTWTLKNTLNVKTRLLESTKKPLCFHSLNAYKTLIFQSLEELPGYIIGLTTPDPTSAEYKSIEAVSSVGLRAAPGQVDVAVLLQVLIASSGAPRVNCPKLLNLNTEDYLTRLLSCTETQLYMLFHTLYQKCKSQLTIPTDEEGDDYIQKNHPTLATVLKVLPSKPSS